MFWAVFMCFSLYFGIGCAGHLAHLWATSDCAPRSEALGTPRQQGLCSHLVHLWSTSDSALSYEAVGNT